MESTGGPGAALQEEEAKIKPGTDKHIAFQALKEAGSGGLNVDQIMEAAKQSGITDLDDNSKRVIQYVSRHAAEETALPPFLAPAAADQASPCMCLYRLRLSIACKALISQACGMHMRSGRHPLVSHMDSATGMPSQALANDLAFQRTAKGVYTLRALAPEINSPVPQPKTKGQRTPRPPPPRFDPSALTPEPSAVAGLDDAGGDDAVPLDFLDGSSVLAPMPAGTRPEDVHIEAEYIEPVKEEAPENVSSASPNSVLDPLSVLKDWSTLHMLKDWSTLHMSLWEALSY